MEYASRVADIFMRRLDAMWFPKVSGFEKVVSLEGIEWECTKDRTGESAALLQYKVRKWSQEPLPCWSVDPWAVSVVNGEEHPDEADVLTKFPHCVMAILSAAAWKYAFFATVILWLWWACFPMIVLTPFAATTVHCASNSAGLAETPRYLIAPFLPILIVALALEAKVHSLTLPALSRLGAYKLPVLGVEVKPFKVYFGMMLGVSLSAHLDLFTNGLVFVKLQVSRSCPDNLVETVWSEVVTNSAIPWLPSITCLGMAVWLAMGAQLVVALGHGIPNSIGTCSYLFTPCRPACVVDHYRKQFEKLTRMNEEEPSEIDIRLSSLPLREYSGLLGGTCSAEHMMLALAEASRMCLVTFRAYDYLKLFITTLGTYADTSASGAMFQLPVDPGLAMATLPTRDVAEYLVMNLRREVRRVLLFMIFESAVQANVQSSVLGINKAISGAVDKLTVLSMSITLAMSALNLGLGAVRVKTLSKFVFGLSGLADEVEEFADEEYIRDFQRMKRSVVCNIFLFIVLAGICVLLLLYAFMKVVAATICPQGVWNIGGCVQLDAVLLA